MKIILIFLLCQSIVPIYATTTDLSGIQNFLSEEQVSVSEDGFLPSSNQVRSLDFARSVTKTWEECLTNIESLAPDSRRQSLIVVAGEFLPPKEYVKFVDALCNLRESGRLVPEALRFVLWARMGKSGFLAFNIQEPQIEVLTSRIERLINKDFPGDWDAFFHDMRSGSMKMRIARQREEAREKQPQLLSENDSEPYRQLVGGNFGSDIRLVVRRPVEAVASVLSENRTKGSLYAALGTVILGACALWMVLRKFLRNRK